MTKIIEWPGGRPVRTVHPEVFDMDAEMRFTLDTGDNRTEPKPKTPWWNGLSRENFARWLRKSGGQG